MRTKKNGVISHPENVRLFLTQTQLDLATMLGYAFLLLIDINQTRSLWVIRKIGD